MVNRIQEIIKRNNLTASRFADQLEVPRSTISHILSERNKPSLEFIQKVLDKFPEISVTWLIKGEGDMLAGQKNLFSTHDDLPEYKDSDTHETSSAKPSESATDKIQIKDDEIYDKHERELSAKKEVESVEKEEYTSQKYHENNGRKILKIIVIYENNTFEEYKPAQ